MRRKCLCRRKDTLVLGLAEEITLGELARLGSIIPELVSIGAPEPLNFIDRVVRVALLIIIPLQRAKIHGEPGNLLIFVIVQSFDATNISFVKVAVVHDLNILSDLAQILLKVLVI